MVVNLPQFSYFAELNQEQQEMNADNFTEFLSDKSNLYKLSYEELKTLSLQFPYSSNLQLLLTLKSKMEQHKDFEKNLAKAATLCPDRKHLLLRIKEIDVSPVQAENLVLKEDYLELKDLSALDNLDKVEVEPPVETEQNGKQEISENLKAQLQHTVSDEDPTDNNPFLNSSGKDYEDINLSETLLNNLLVDEESEIIPQSELNAQIELVPETEIPTPSESSDSPLTDTDPIPESEPQSEPQPDLRSESEPEPTPTIEFTPPISFSEESTSDSDTEIPLEPKPEPLLQPLPSYHVPENTMLNLVAASKIIANMEKEVIPEPVMSDSEVSIAEKPSNATGMPKPSPKSSFTSWIQQFQPEHTKLRLDELMEARKLEELKRKRKKKKKKKKKKSKMILIAEQSITENTEIATDTLADLLTQQEQYEKAIQVYHRLIEMYPEKKAYYQTKIFEIQNKDLS